MKEVARPYRPMHNVLQWNLDFTIWQGDSKIISLNRDIVVNELPIYKQLLLGHRMLIVKSGISLNQGSSVF